MPNCGRVVFDNLLLIGSLIIGAGSWVESLHGIRVEGSIHGIETLDAAVSIEAHGTLVILNGDITAGANIDAGGISALGGSIKAGRNLVSIADICVRDKIIVGNDMIAEGNVHCGGNIQVTRKIATEGGVFLGGNLKAGLIAVRHDIVTAGTLSSEGATLAGSITASGTLEATIFEVRDHLAANQAGDPEISPTYDVVGVKGTVLRGFDVWKATAPLAMTQPIETLHNRFLVLANEWRRKCGFISSIERLTAIPEYQEIVRMGSVAIPWIMAELRQQPDHWFVALRSIAGVDPVKPENVGNIKAMAADCFEWFEQCCAPLRE